MATMHRFPAPVFMLGALLWVCLPAPSAAAQLGPNTAQIPGFDQTPQTSDASPDGAPVREPSMSEAMRPAIDEILLAQARASQTQQDGGSGAMIPQSETDTETALPAPAAPGLIRGDLRPSTESLPIGRSRVPPGALADDAASGRASVGPRPLSEGWLQTLMALSGVVLLILGLGQLYKRLARAQGGLAGRLGAGGSAPTGILEVIGRYPVSRGMTLVVMKFDRRVLLVAHGASSGRGKIGRASSMRTLCELTDPEDVASVLLKARSASGESIAQSFERALRDADDITDEYLHDYEPENAEFNRVRFPSQRREPARTISNDEGDRAELWSSGSESSAASGVLRKRLGSMRRGRQG